VEGELQMLPAGHGFMVVEPDGQKLPMVQFTLVDVVLQKDPTAHDAFTVEPEGQKEPRVQL
jgi:hypothetical protein